ncbi:hypothetical protein FRX31_025905 [Thalictrum thalictroides]|uniref:Uncharacterized protein n=1 Tax=Thalictrum thalictroides TaxID=46969 RepID=A0A7J6VIW2_THATH|nr:hypothetical protein FRX31_025905 [Thalictrum thalictroides]
MNCRVWAQVAIQRSFRKLGRPRLRVFTTRLQLQQFIYLHLILSKNSHSECLLPASAIHISTSHSTKG